MRNAPVEPDDRAAVAEGVPAASRHSLKHRVIEQLRFFFFATLYLWIILGLLSLYRSLVLAQNHLDYTSQGFAILNAMVLAKVMLVAEDLHLGDRFKEHRLIYAVLYKSFASAFVLICFHIIERVAISLLHGRPLAGSLGDFGGNRLWAIMSMGAILWVALVPFFSFREVARVVGSEPLRKLFLDRGTRTLTLSVQD